MANQPLPTPGDEGWRDAWREALTSGLSADETDAAMAQLNDVVVRGKLWRILDDMDSRIDATREKVVRLRSDLVDVEQQVEGLDG